ncbi:MAG: phosphate ABC transporter substrate-binding protein [Gammaproteobacteria bacterium]|nr:phosphate ABC transporter substrate-binding protein [Gammaproteobacteria bacterium]
MFAFRYITGAFLAIFIATSASADLAIISHPDYDGGEINSLQVKNLFLGERKSFPNGIKATPINHAVGSPDRKKFFSLVLNMAESFHGRHWKRKMATNSGSSPAELNSYKEVLRSVAKTPGSISYIDSSMVNDSVKVLFTIEDFDDV